MTEEEWVAADNADQPLAYIQKKASARKLRLVAAAFARWAYSLPGHESAIPCGDLIEEVADDPKPYSDLEPRLSALRGWTYEFVDALRSDEDLGLELSKLLSTQEILSRHHKLSSSKHPERFHAAHRTMIQLFHEMFGNPFRAVAVSAAWLTWNAGTIPKLAEGIYTDRAFDRLPILADALEDAGCDNADMLAHCRGPGPHVRGCWVVDLLLGKQ